MKRHTGPYLPKPREEIIGPKSCCTHNFWHKLFFFSTFERKKKKRKSVLRFFCPPAKQQTAVITEALMKLRPIPNNTGLYLTLSRTSDKCLFKRCSLLRTLSMSHCRSSMRPSRCETRDSAFSNRDCSWVNWTNEKKEAVIVKAWGWNAVPYIAAFQQERNLQFYTIHAHGQHTAYLWKNSYHLIMIISSPSPVTPGILSILPCSLTHQLMSSINCKPDFELSVSKLKKHNASGSYHTWTELL